MTLEIKLRLPVLVRIAVALTFLNSFVLFEELIVDRLGLWRYLPLYRLGKFCIWDLAAACGSLLVAFGGWRSFTKTNSSR